MPGSGAELAGQVLAAPTGAELAGAPEEFDAQVYLDSRGIGDLGATEVLGHDGVPMTVAAAVNLCPRIAGAIDVMIDKGTKFVSADKLDAYVRESVLEIVAPPPTEEAKARMASILAGAAMRDQKKKLETAAAAKETVAKPVLLTAERSLAEVKAEIMALRQLQPVKESVISVSKPSVSPEVAVSLSRVHEVHAAQEASQKMQIEQVVAQDVARPIEVFEKAPEAVVIPLSKKVAVVAETVVEISKVVASKATRRVETTSQKETPIIRVIELGVDLPEVAVHEDNQTIESVEDLVEPTPFSAMVEELFVDAPAEESIEPLTYDVYEPSEISEITEVPEYVEAIVTEPSEVVDQEVNAIPALFAETTVSEQVQEKLAELEPEQALAAANIMENIAAITRRLRKIEMMPEKGAEVQAITEAIEELYAELRKTIKDGIVLEQLIKKILQPAQESAKQSQVTARRIKFLQSLGTHELKLDGIGLYGMQAHVRGLNQQLGQKYGQIGKVTIYYSQHKRILQRA